MPHRASTNKYGGNLELPWPPAALSPNAKHRKHWRHYRPIAAKYRDDCHILTQAWMRAYEVPKAAGLQVASVTFYPPDRRRRDDDGMIGAFKAGRDGVANALGVDDNTFRPSYNFAEPVKNGRVIVVLEGA